jgi:hypothetical protein
MENYRDIPAYYNKYRILFNDEYFLGIGLDMVVDKDYMFKETIEEEIDLFLDHIRNNGMVNSPLIELGSDRKHNFLKYYNRLYKEE